MFTTPPTRYFFFAHTGKSSVELNKPFVFLRRINIFEKPPTLLYVSKFCKKMRKTDDAQSKSI